LEIYYALNEVEYVAKEILKNIKCNTILLFGEIGVGKTTLVKALVKLLGSNDNVSSPTYSIVNEYEIEHKLIYHFDLFRINTINEAYNFGIEDYLTSKNFKIIEWPELILDIINEDFVTIEIKKATQKTRNLTITNNNIT